jgi:site-specific recombinase XerD
MAEIQDGFDVRFTITPHVFRHSKSVHLLQSGVNLIYIRDLLGHSDCSTTQIYAKADTETRRKALEAAYSDILPTNELPDWSDDKNLMDFLIAFSK